MPSRLLSPIRLRSLELQNRIVLAPMTQFSASDGVAGDWHFVHLGQFAVSGFGLVLTESTYVTPESRNTPSCLSLYTDEQEAAIGRIARFFKANGQARFGVQLCHAGRKASARVPALGGGPLSPEEGAYPTCAPSPIPLAEGWPVPRALEPEGMRAVRDAFAQSARRAVRLGADLIEVHSAHGYLLHQFLSPLSNRREDDYGGALGNRLRFPLEVFDAVREAVPQEIPVGVRVSATDWFPGGWDVAQTVEYAKALEARGCDYLHVSSGGLTREQRIVDGPGYQTGFAATIKAALKRMAVIAVGQISTARQAETILQTGQADMIGVARSALYNPRWVWHAADELGELVRYPRQYERGHPARWGLKGVNFPGNLEKT